MDHHGHADGRVFPTVQVHWTEGGNHIVLAFSERRTREEITSKLKAGDGPEWAHALAKRAADEMVEFEPLERATIFTDDKAPIEEMTRRMLMESSKTK